jgi:hypothetical protein
VGIVPTPFASRPPEDFTVKALVTTLAALLASSAAMAEPLINPFNPTRPTVSITGAAGLGSGKTSLDVRQTSQFNAAAGVVVAPRGSVAVSQQGVANGAVVGVFGNHTNAFVSQNGRLGNFATIRQATPTFSGRR